MSFRFRQSITLFPGVRLNLSKSGISVSAGVPGATVNLGRQGAALTLGIPGTGLSYRTQLTGGASQPLRPIHQPPTVSDPRDPGAGATPSGNVLLGEIRSADIAHLTSPDLAGLKEMILAAEVQRRHLKTEWNCAIEARSSIWREINRSKGFPQRFWRARRLPELHFELETVEGEAKRISDAYAASFVSLDFTIDEQVIAAFQRLDASHADLAACAAIWDVTSSVATDRWRDRTVAETSITRTGVTLGRSQSSLIAARWSALKLGNANGAAVEILPVLCLMRRSGGGDFALLDLRDVELVYQMVRFQEHEGVPRDSKIVGHTWLKANADGSPDRRFRENRQIPIALYGRLEFRTKTGLEEAYMFSDPARVTVFAECFVALQDALRGQEDKTVEGSALVSVPNTAVHGTLSLPALQSERELRTPLWPFVSAAAVLAVAGWFALVPRSGVPTMLVGPSLPPTSASAESLPAKATPQPVTSPVTTLPSAASSQIERVMTRQGANLRAQANGSAEILRTVPAATPLRVFGRIGNWMRVGEREPEGWIHNSLLVPVQ